MRIFEFIKKMKAKLPKYQPLVEIRVSRGAILDNYAAFQRAVPALKIAPVLKSNAYGHGLVAVASILKQTKPPFFAVDSPYEVAILRRAGIDAETLVFDYTTPRNIINFRLPKTSFAIVDLAQLREVAGGLRHSCRIHLKVDTGMHRQGIDPADLPAAFAVIREQPKLIVEGIFSHFADPVGNAAFSRTQLKNWNEALAAVRDEFPNLRYWHISASSGYILKDRIDANVARVGIGLYGIAPYLGFSLRPALELVTSISTIKAVPKGGTIGYNRSYEAATNILVATLPLGYFEGVDLRLSNSGVAKVKAYFCPIVGRVSMNLTSIDVSQVPNARPGDPVVIISSDPKAPNSVDNIARQCRTIPYEILVHLPAQLRRTVV